MMANLRMYALLVLLLAGFAVAANASVTPQLRDDGARVLPDGATISVQMVASGVLHVHYVPAQRRATPSSLVIDPHPTMAPSYQPQASKRGDVITLRSNRMVVSWDPKTGELQVAGAHGMLLQQTDYAAMAQGRIVLDHAWIPAQVIAGSGDTRTLGLQLGDFQTR